MTAKPLLRTPAAVNSERNIAMGAHHHISTAATAQKRAVSTPWHQHNGLFASLRELCETVHQSATDQAFVALRQFMAHIDNSYRGQWLAGNS